MMEKKLEDEVLYIYQIKFSGFTDSCTKVFFSQNFLQHRNEPETIESLYYFNAINAPCHRIK